MKTHTNFSAIALAQFATLCAAFLMASSVCAQESEKVIAARELVEQAQLHQLAALGMRLSVRRAVVDGNATQEFLECVSAADPSIFSSHIATLYAGSLGMSELKDAVRFFAGAAGQKYVAYTFRGTEEYAGFTPTTPPVTVTVDEKRLINRFVTSVVGKRMSETQSPLAITPPQEMAKIVEPILAKCRQPRPPVRAQLGRDRLSYAASIAAKIKSHTVYHGNLDSVPGNPKGSFRIEQLPNGEVASVKIIESSGVPDYDAAVVKGIYHASPLPKSIDGTVERVIIVNSSMKGSPHEK